MARTLLQYLSGIANTTGPVPGTLQGSPSFVQKTEPQFVDDLRPVRRLQEFTAVNSDEDKRILWVLRGKIGHRGQECSMKNGGVPNG